MMYVYFSRDDVRMCWHTSSPFFSGIIQSRIAIGNVSLLNASSACAPSCAITTSCPALTSAVRSSSSDVESSSAIRMCIVVSYEEGGRSGPRSSVRSSAWQVVGGAAEQRLGLDAHALELLLEMDAQRGHVREIAGGAPRFDLA